MKNSLIAFALFCSSYTMAQITITQSDMPNPGDSILVSMANDIGPNDLETSDSNYVWDYSMLVPTLQRYEKFDDPLGFTLPFNLLFSPFTCSYGKANNLLTTGGGGIPGLTIDEAYDFLRESSGKYRQVGVGYRINGIPLPFDYATDDVIYRFPLNYADTDTGDYEYGLPIPSLGYYGQAGHRETIVDGWGTLTTPFGTFNTLRVKATISATDTIYLDTLGFGFAFQRPLRYEYKWLANGKKIPVLQVDATDIFGLPVIDRVTYIDSIIPGVPSLGIASVSTSEINTMVFPNPASDNTTLVYALGASSSVKIRLADITGREIYSVLNDVKPAGTYSEKIDLSGVNEGMYLLILETGKGRAVQRIVVSR